MVVQVRVNNSVIVFTCSCIFACVGSINHHYSGMFNLMMVKRGHSEDKHVNINTKKQKCTNTTHMTNKRTNKLLYPGWSHWVGKVAARWVWPRWSGLQETEWRQAARALKNIARSYHTDTSEYIIKQYLFVMYCHAHHHQGFAPGLTESWVGRLQCGWRLAPGSHTEHTSPVRSAEHCGWRFLPPSRTEEESLNPSPYKPPVKKRSLKVDGDLTIKAFGHVLCSHVIILSFLQLCFN